MCNTHPTYSDGRNWNDHQAAWGDKVALERAKLWARERHFRMLMEASPSMASYYERRILEEREKERLNEEEKEKDEKGKEGKSVE
jgi:hypothetical protein